MFQMIISTLYENKNQLMLTFLPYREKKNYSTLEMVTFKVMLLVVSYLDSLDKKPQYI